jgi:hypothetical protein
MEGMFSCTKSAAPDLENIGSPEQDHIHLRRQLSYCIIIFFLLTGGYQAIAQRTLRTDVLVVGGGASGVTAGIQAARMGVRTLIAEPTVWLGGMVSAAGVSAFDGNHNMPSGIWAEFRERIYQHYGGSGKVATGWVSNTLFEPHVADSIFKAMAAAQPQLSVAYRYQFTKTLLKGKKILGAVFYDAASKVTVNILAKQVIDATELGDVMAGAGIAFDVGMEASSLTGENVNVPQSNDIIQDLTYVAILKDYGPTADCTLVRPPLYDPLEFDCCCNEFCSQSAKLTSNVTAQKMLDYGRLPNGKYMINWPGKGNDSYLNIIAMSEEERGQALLKAKAKTLRFLYFLQTQFGFRHLGLANDEFPTADRLALMPYHREGRRLKGLVRFKIQHIADPFHQPLSLYRTGIAVGDYPVDHHHRENPNAPQHLGFYPVPSYNVPMGALIPPQHEGIIIAEKGISVSNVVNGTTRLQPCVMLIGQAAGTLAALAVQKRKPAMQVRVREVQAQLLNDGAYIMPYFDVKPANPYFKAIQRIGATGILKGKGEPFQWANRTWFYPDSLVDAASLERDIAPFIKSSRSYSGHLKIADALELIGAAGFTKADRRYKRSNLAALTTQVQSGWMKWGLNNFDTQRPITRAEFAVLLDEVLVPFSTRQVTIEGQLIK